MVPNKRTLIVVSSLAAIPLSAVLIAIAIHRKRSKSLRAHELLDQTKRKRGVVTTITAPDRQQLNGKKSQSQQQQQLPPPPSSPWQGSDTEPVVDSTPTNTNVTTRMTTKSTDTSSAAVASPVVASITSSPDSPAAVSHKTQKEEEEEMSVSEEAKKAGESLKELVVAAVKGAKDSAKKTGKRLKGQTLNIAATTDSKDIRSLGDNTDALVDQFEEMMTEIRREQYDDQIKLLDSYKQLLHTQIKVVDVRRRMASKLKPGA
jgi:hypothetical protein